MPTVRKTRLGKLGTFDYIFRLAVGTTLAMVLLAAAATFLPDPDHVMGRQMYLLTTLSAWAAVSIVVYSLVLAMIQIAGP